MCQLRPARSRGRAYSYDPYEWNLMPTWLTVLCALWLSGGLVAWIVYMLVEKGVL